MTKDTVGVLKLIHRIISPPFTPIVGEDVFCFVTAFLYPIRIQQGVPKVFMADYMHFLSSAKLAGTSNQATLHLLKNSQGQGVFCVAVLQFPNVLRQLASFRIPGSG